MKNILGFFYGLVYGIAHIVPGLSGGTFLVIFGCYDKVCEAFALNFKIIKKHFLFFIMFGIGTIAGLVGFVFAVTFLLDNFGVQTDLFFMGLILGGVPLINHLAQEEEKWSPKCIIPFILGLGLIVGLFVLEKFGVFGSLEAEAGAGFNLLFSLQIAAYAFIAAVAMVMPGISGAFVLVAFGVYEVFTGALKEFDFIVLAPAIVGILLGIVLGAKLVLFLLKKFKLLVYSAIMGMVLGSVVPIFPHGFGLNVATLTGVIFLIAGFALAFVLGKKEMS